METAQQVLVPEVPRWLARLQPGLSPDFQVKFLGKKGEELFASNPGPQTWSLLCPFEEVLIGGRRGGGKSRCLIARAAMGDLTLPEGDPARTSYLNDRAFRAVLLREEYQSMAEFVEEAIEFYRPFGGKAAGDPKHIDFASGARIYFNHINDEEAFSKYKGWNITFIGIEEGTQIKTLRRYLKLMGSLRSVDRWRGGKRYPPLRTQIFMTANPDGPGGPWITARFVDVPGKDGKFIAWNTPMRDPITGSVRIFIPFGLEANPYLAETTVAGKRYRAMLLSQDEVTRKQWMEGDWHAGSVRFFMDYRPDGPTGEEEQRKFPWARHIVRDAPLKPWWFRWGSGDWGYDHPAAFHKFVRNESDKRIHVYDELQVRRVGSFELGALLAKWWHPELIALQACGREPSVTIHLGADAFSKTDFTKTNAEQMAAGIREVLGPSGALLLKFDETEQEAMLRNPQQARAMFERRKAQLEGHMHIALRPTYVERIAAWAYMRDLLRFRSAVLDLQTPEQRMEFLKATLAQEGPLAYELKAEELRNREPEVLPKLQIWSVCKELDRCLRNAQRDTRNDDDPAKISRSEDVLKFNADDQGLGGDDALESARNGCLAYKEIEVAIPKSYWVAEEVSRAQAESIENFGEELTDPTRLAMIAQCQAARYDRREGVRQQVAFSLPRLSSQRHRGLVN